MPEANEFDIYQTPSGYVAVTNVVRRAILEALAKKEGGLPELAKITGKAKPTLSNLHVRELLTQGLIEEIPHPTDARKKLYRMKGTRIGSSNVPIATLRGAVKRYVAQAPLAHALPLQQVLDVLLAAGPRSRDAVGKQARRLGQLAGPLFLATDPRELLPRIAAYWEREGITHTVRIDLEDLALELDVNPRYVGSKDAARTAASLLAGFLRGALDGREGKPPRVSGEALSPERVRIAINAPKRL